MIEASQALNSLETDQQCVSVPTSLGSEIPKFIFMAVCKRIPQLLTFFVGSSPLNLQLEYFEILKIHLSQSQQV